MSVNNGNQKLNGLNPLAYLGVNSQQPPDLIMDTRAPTTTDFAGFQLGTLWLYNNNTVTPNIQYVYILVSVSNSSATWSLISSSTGDITKITADSGTVLPDALGNVNERGGTSVGGAATNINTIGSGSTLSICLNNSISQPNTNSSGTTGMYSLGGTSFLHNFGNHNVFLGSLAGNLTTTGTGGNIGIGTSTLIGLTTSSANTIIGSGAATSIMAGNGGNTALGFGVLSLMGNGANNIAIGYFAGINYGGTESSNILIGNDGVLGESHVMRLGTSGSGAGQVNTTYIAGPTMNISTDAIAGIITIGNVTGTTRVNINTGTGGSAITTTNGAISVNSGTGVIGVSTDAATTTVNFATGAGIKTVTLGSTNTTSATTVQSGSGALNVTSTNGALTVNSGTGALSISNDAAATTVNIATGGGIKTTTLGSLNTTSATTINSGSGAITIGQNGGTGAVNIGNTTGNTAVTGTLSATGKITSSAGSLYAGGDTSGVASQNALTSVSDLTANGAGTFTIKSKSANNLDSSGFIKIYIGTTAYYVPVFSAIAP